MPGFPVDISEHGHLLDELFYLTFYLTGGTFLIVVAILGWFLWRYLARAGQKAVYSHGNSRGALGLSIGLALAVFVFIDLNLAYHDHHVFQAMFGSPPKEEDALVVDMVAEVFQWNFRYAGDDGKFGKIDLSKASANDPFGMAAQGDPLGKDDITSVGVLAVPVNRDVVLKMKSRDVIHSLFLPNLRIKQDVVPGLETTLYFKAVRAGEYEIGCAELCGLGHYKMRGFLKVLEPEQYAAWMKDHQQTEFDDEEFSN